MNTLAVHTAYTRARRHDGGAADHAAGPGGRRRHGGGADQGPGPAGADVEHLLGVLLAVLFLAFQAPDVTLSELTIGAVVLPVVILLTLAKVRKPEQ